MYKIGELSKLCNISVKTLRYYDAEGLLIPDEIDKFTGYRYYSASKLSDCYKIIALKELGFSLDEIRAQMAADDNSEIVESLNAKLTELKGLIQSTEKQLRKIETMRDNLIEGEKKMFDIIIRETDEIRVALLRKNYLNKEEALNEINEIEKKLPKRILGKRKVIINYETEYREEDSDLAACVEITEKLPKDSAFQEKSISFGEKVASLICSKEELDDAYKAMILHLDGSVHKVCGAYYEIYHEDGTVELKVPVCEKTTLKTYCTEDLAPFTDDPEVCGKWEMIDILPTREHFVYGKPKCNHLGWLNELYFIDGGKGYWAVYGWTKGKLYTYGQKQNSVLVNNYTMESDGNRRLLFLEMNDYCDGNEQGVGTHEIWVYEKVENRHYTSAEEIRRVDNIDYPFINDESVLGVWNVRDFVHGKEEFDPQKQNFPKEDFFVLQVIFKPDGAYETTIEGETDTSTSIWTKGLVLNRREKTASAYEIKVIDGKEYLFKEWKCGDYSFGNGRVYWYVFTRE